MNKFKNSMDKIQMNEEDKKRVLNNILNHKKKRFTLNTFAYRFAVFLAIFTIAIGSGYAIVKVFKLDDRFSEFFGLNGKIKDQIEVNGRDINIVNHYDNYDINFKQIVIGYNKFDLIFSIENIKNDASLKDFIITKGDIDESKIEITKADIDYSSEYIDDDAQLDDMDLTEIFYNDDNYSGGGFGMIDDLDGQRNYIASYSSRDRITAGEYTIRFYDNNLEYHDVKFNIINTDIRTVNYDKKDILYNKDNIIVTNDKMTITNSDIYIEADSNEIEKINNLDYDIINFSDSSIKTKDGEIIPIGGECFTKDNKVIMIFEYSNNFIDIDNIESLIINDIEIKISD